MLMSNNLDVTKCLQVIQRGALGVAELKLQMETKDTTVLTASYS